MWRYIVFIVKIGLLLLLMQQCYTSWIKYQMKKKLISNQIINTEYIFYPSVTVCIDTAFKMYLDHEVFAEGNDHMMDTFKLLKEQHWKLNEIFYFVNQASSNNKGYPCMTMASSNDPGRPCSFPFTRDWPDMEVKTYNECTNVENLQ